MFTPSSQISNGIRCAKCLILLILSVMWAGVFIQSVSTVSTLTMLSFDLAHMIPSHLQIPLGISLSHTILCLICIGYVRSSSASSLFTSSSSSARTIGMICVCTHMMIILIIIASQSGEIRSTPSFMSSFIWLDIVVFCGWIAIIEEIFYRGYLREVCARYAKGIIKRTYPSLMNKAHIHQISGWCCCLLFILMHPLPFVFSSFDWFASPTLSTLNISWGVVMLSVYCEGLRQMGISVTWTAASHMLANGSVYLFRYFAPGTFDWGGWLFL